MLQSDVHVLDELLGPKLIFTNHLGKIMTKKDDLEAHQSGMLSIEVLTLTELQVQVIGEVAIVTAQAHLVGSYAGNKSEADFRFTRVWAFSETWRVIVAHSTLVT